MRIFALLLTPFSLVAFFSLSVIRAVVYCIYLYLGLWWCLLASLLQVHVVYVQYPRAKLLHQGCPYMTTPIAAFYITTSNK
ncbi:hypothetical protein V8C43DRAFT_169159 [Trichoderma afarasin]